MIFVEGRKYIQQVRSFENKETYGLNARFDTD